MSSAFPPTRSTPSIPLPATTALKYLQTYLTSLPNNPHLLPNARLSSSGPTAGSSTSSITIHNLERVEAGLRGEWLAPTLELEEEGNINITEGMDDGTNKNGDQGEWQDLTEYQRQQSIEGGETVQNNMGVVQEGDSELEVEGKVKGQEDGDGGSEEEVEAPKAKKLKRSHGDDAKVVQKPLDKEARKREKKARDKAFKAQKAREQATA